MKLSIIIPVLNEKRINQVINQVKKQNPFEIIIVDGNGSTLKLIKDKKVKKILSNPGRGIQLNNGAKLAKGDMLVFLHADTKLNKNSLSLIKGEWGAFYHKYNTNNLLIKLTAFRGNSIRLNLFHIAYGDQLIFVKRKLFNKIKGYPKVKIMEDIEISKKLRKISKPYIVKDPVISSTQKFDKLGALKYLYLIWKIRIMYFLGVHPDKIYKIYYN